MKLEHFWMFNGSCKFAGFLIYFETKNTTDICSLHDPISFSRTFPLPLKNNIFPRPYPPDFPSFQKFLNFFQFSLTCRNPVNNDISLCLYAGRLSVDEWRLVLGVRVWSRRWQEVHPSCSVGGAQSDAEGSAGLGPNGRLGLRTLHLLRLIRWFLGNTECLKDILRSLTVSSLWLLKRRNWTELIWFSFWQT